MEKFYRVYYLGHSAWAVETAEHYLLFDVQDENVKDGGSLEEGTVDLTKLAGKKVFMLYSHFHHDHYSKRLHKKSAESGIGFTILGDFSARMSETTAKMEPHEKTKFGEITVHTGDSTDAGVCWQVEADGVSIFFAGDNADWADGDPDNGIYYKEIDYMAAQEFKTDIAFIPVCTFSGARPEPMTRGAIYAVGKLNPSLTFPMHANGREELLAEFAKDLKATGNDSKVICAKQKGITASTGSARGK